MNYFNNDYWRKVFEFAKNLNDVDEPTQYAIDVISNLILTSKMVYYQCARHLLFLYKEVHDPNFLFTYKKSAYENILNFSKMIIIPETKKQFIFTDFRKFISGFVFGWVYKSDPDKLMTSEVFDIESRKQWKSSYWAMISLATTLGLLKDGSSEVYFCGASKDSSKIPYNMCLGYIRNSLKLSKLFIKANSIRILSKKYGVIKALSFEKGGIEGKNPSLTILTEYHLHKDNTMQESAMTAKNLSRKNQLIVYDTTKGLDLNSVCYKKEKDFKSFLIQQMESPQELNANYSLFLFCAELDEEDEENWRDFNLWKKSNPGLGITVSLDDLKKELAQITTKSAEVEFKAKRLGLWSSLGSAYFNLNDLLVSQEANREIVNDFISSGKIKEHTALLGIDLSSTTDTTAICLNWEIPQEDGESIYVFKFHSFIPSQAITKKEVSDKANYRDWHNKGFLTFSDGTSIDYNLVIQKIQEWKNEYKIKTLLYDPWQFYSVKTYLLNNNLFYDDEIKPVKQGVHLTPAFRQFESKLQKNKVYFIDDNDLAISQLLNVSIKYTQSISQTFFIKKLREQSRIDAFVSMLNTIAERHNIQAQEQESFFDLIN
ncbi:terminase large subunit [Mycoplasmopsis phage vB_Mfe_PMF329]|nr:terminase large subunit [Mycoplasmopsis phage vB_Mfe_PMF329]